MYDKFNSPEPQDDGGEISRIVCELGTICSPEPVDGDSGN